MENRLSAPGRPYRAVCFDLDGTLLPMDLEEFLQGYFGRLGRYAAEQGEDAEAVMGAVGRSVKAMTSNDGARTNEELFWDFFAKAVGQRWEARDWPAFFNDFYEGPFREVGALMTANPAAARAVEALAAKGYPLALTTMPLFPRVAVEERLRWAGVDPALFNRITTFDNSRSAKPHLGYYAENLRALGVEGRDVLMVGNNTVEDWPSATWAPTPSWSPTACWIPQATTSPRCATEAFRSSPTGPRRFPPARTRLATSARGPWGRGACDRPPRAVACRFAGTLRAPPAFLLSWAHTSGPGPACAAARAGSR